MNKYIVVYKNQRESFYSNQKLNKNYLALLFNLSNERIIGLIESDGTNIFLDDENFSEKVKGKTLIIKMSIDPKNTQSITPKYTPKYYHLKFRIIDCTMIIKSQIIARISSHQAKKRKPRTQSRPIWREDLPTDVFRIHFQDKITNINYKIFVNIIDDKSEEFVHKITNQTKDYFEMHFYGVFNSSRNSLMYPGSLVANYPNAEISVVIVIED